MTTRVFLIAAMMWTGHLPPCAGAEPKPAEKTAEPQQRAAVWIDVRTPGEYAAGHLEGAANIPYDVIGGRIAALVPDKNTEIRLYCRSGRRSGVARQTLLDLGYTKVFNDGAYEKLRKDRADSARK